MVGAGIILAVAVGGRAAGAVVATSAAGTGSTVTIAVLGDEPLATLSLTQHKSEEPHDRVLRQLADDRFAIGLLSTDLGSYDRRQALLDMSQGTRQPRSLYGTARPTVSYPSVDGPGCLGGWDALVGNARRASVTLVPGLLAGSVPGGGAFVGTGPPGGLSSSVSILAADTRGCVADVSLGAVDDLTARTQAAALHHRLVVVGLPSGRPGWDAVSSLAAAQGPKQLLIVTQLPPKVEESRLRSPLPSRFLNQTDIGAKGLGGGGRLGSATTRQPGLVTTIDVAPTALRFLGIPVPDRMRGQVITTEGKADALALERLRRRWGDVRNNRQLASYRTVLLLSLLLLVLMGTVRGVRRGLTVGLRALGLAVLWWPLACLAVAVLSPRSGDSEVLGIAALALALAVVTDALLPWPRGPVAPAAALLVGLTADLARGGHVLTQSVLGPSVTSGSRFYGISNEFEPILPVVALAGLAAFTTWRRWDARPRVGLYTVVGAALAIVVGWGRLGADVGGVVTVGAGFAGALVLGNGRLTRAKLLLLVATPVVALLGLVGLDLVSHGGDHLSNNLSRSGGGTDLWELVARRYELALHVVSNGGMAIRLGIALLVAVFVARNREVMLGPDISRPWTAALLGGLAAGAAGALSNDSGPVLFVNAILTLVGVVAYLRGRPDDARLRSAGDQSPAGGQRWDTVGSRG
ncbi:MAG: hypothetical protein QOG03_1444 [Actinomycetota bacterium]|jgi:hypothetical protein|nr:hypothetical protein [Actinomycetota bacterium]